jgi:outer membrane protein assembly factor BamB
MRRIGGSWRNRRVLISVGAVLVCVAGAVAGFVKMDRERRQDDPQRLDKLAVVSLPALQAPAETATDWPQWRGPNRDGVAPLSTRLTDWPSQGPRILWKQAIGRGFSSVAVAHGRLFTMEQEPVSSPPDGSPSPHFEAVICRDARDGREIWRFHYPNDYDERFGPGPRSTPAVDGTFVYTVGPTGIFHCLQADSGAVVWRHDLQEEFQGRKMQYGVAFSPLVDGNLVFATPGGPNRNAVVAFDKHSGRVVWKALDDPMGYSSPMLTTAAGVRQLLVFTNEALVSLAPADGTVYWRFPWQTENGFNIATPLVLGNYVFISSAYRKGCALLEITAEGGTLHVNRVYEHNRMRNYFASSVRWGEHIYGFDEVDLVCMNVRTGAIVWREKGIRSFRKGSVLLVGGQLIILSEEGTLWLAEATPEGYRAKASVRVSTNKCWTVPAWADGRLYVRDESQIVCLEMPATPTVAGR